MLLFSSKRFTCYTVSCEWGETFRRIFWVCFQGQGVRKTVK